jgi:hypothetical protein
MMETKQTFVGAKLTFGELFVFYLEHQKAATDTNFTYMFYLPRD